MATKLYIKLQSPSIELKVQAKDSAGTKDSIVVGFKRYGLAEGTVKSEEFQEIQLQAYINAKAKLQEQLKVYQNETSTEILPEVTMSEQQVLEATDRFLKNEILYIKQVNLTTENDAGIVKELNIADTRSAKPNEPLWVAPEDCLSVLVSSFLDCAPYRGSLIAAQQKALANVDYQEAEIKN